MSTSIIDILMKRDKCTKEEAVKTLENARSMINDAIASGDGYDVVEEIMYEELGLEMDYIMDVI